MEHSSNRKFTFKSLLPALLISAALPLGCAGADDLSTDDFTEDAVTEAEEFAEKSFWSGRVNSTLTDGEVYYIRSKNSGLYLGIKNASKRQWANVVQYTGPYAGLQWRAEQDGDYWRFKNERSGRYLTVETKEKTNSYQGNAVFQRSYADTEGQLWEVWQEGSNAEFFIRASYSSNTYDSSMTMLDVSGRSKAQGANVHGWTAHWGFNQQWRFSTGITDNNP